ncbi:MAG: universal stress protein [Bacteroidales bacterium]|nr:universal stress protein [Bacteroidales bacterium]MCB9013966.1 universal stress protein [Bacteroidales bacterium]
MIKIKRILIPVDFTKISDEVNKDGIMLAKALKAEVYLIHVVDINRDSFSIIPEAQVVLPPVLEIEKAIEKRMEELRSSIFSQYGIKSEIIVTSGQVYSEILNYSKEKDIDMIIMGTHGASGLKEFFIGTNAQRVATLSEIPVLTLQKKMKKEGFQNILIPIDNSIHSREKVNLAVIFGKLFNAHVHIIGLPASDEESEVAKFKVKVRSVEKILEFDKLEYTSTIIHGDNLAETSLEYAEKKKCDLIVINTGHESRLTGIFLGAFAQQIVNHSKIPVLSLKHKHGYFEIDTPGFGI